MDETVVEVENGRNVSEVVLSAVAEEKGVPLTDLREPLYHAIDPEALDCLFRSAPGRSHTVPTSVRFSYCGLVVRATSDRISVTEAETAAE